MAGQVLSAEVNIETGGAVSRLSVLEARLKKLQNVAADAATGPAKFAKALELIKKTGSEISGLQKLQTQLGQGIPRSSGQATLALTNFNRVVQDAPFGIIGIANNIDPLITSFQSLKASTGSTGAAVKALFSTLAGPTGILFAFSALSTGATLLVQKYGSLGNAFDVLTGKTKELSAEQKKFAEDQKTSEISVEKQRVNLEALVKVAQGDIGTKKQQAAALEELNKLIPDNIGFLTAQNIKTAEGTKILQAYTNAIINQAEAELLAGRAAELRVKLRERDKTLGKDLTREIQNSVKAQQQLNAGTSVGGALSGVNAVTKAVTVNTSEIVKASKVYKDYIADYKELADITARVGVLTAGSIELKMDDPKKTTGKIKEVIEAEINAFNKFLATPEITILPSGVEITDGLKKINTFIQQDINTELATKTFNAPVKVIIKPEFNDKELKKLIDQLNNILETGISGAFTSIGQGLGDALANGTDAIKSLAKGFLNAFGGLITSIGEALIKYGIVKSGLDKIIKGGIALPGITAIGVGLAAVALGQLVKTAIPKFATGGIVTGPTVGMIGEGGQPEVILPLSKINQFMEQGQGGGALTLSVSGDVFQFALARNARKQSRLY